MSQDEVGAYILLLCYQWNHGFIPDDKVRLERIAHGFVSVHVMRKFKQCPYGFKNERLELERAKQEAYRKSRSENGQKGGRPKAHGKHMVLKTKAQHKAYESSPSSSSIVQDPPTPLMAEPSPISAVSDLIKAVGSKWFDRPLDQLPGYEEQRLAFQITKRPGYEKELKEILEWKVDPNDRKYQVPQSLTRLLEQWTETLDKVRTYKSSSPQTRGAAKPDIHAGFVDKDTGHFIGVKPLIWNGQ